MSSDFVRLPTQLSRPSRMLLGVCLMLVLLDPGRETHAFNVAVAELMKLSNKLRDCSETTKSSQAYDGL